MFISVDFETIPREDLNIDDYLAKRRVPGRYENVDQTQSGFRYWVQPDALLEFQLQEHYRMRKSVTPEFAEVIGLGWKVSTEPKAHSVYVGEKKGDVIVDERMLIAKFWSLYEKAQGKIAGFNILKFDLPLALLKVPQHNITMPRSYNVSAKPWERREVDLMFARWGGPYNQLPFKILWQSLKPVVAEKFVIPVQYDTIDEMKGDEVYDLWEKKDYETLKLYVEFDVWRVDTIAKLWSGTFVPASFTD